MIRRLFAFLVAASLALGAFACESPIDPGGHPIEKAKEGDPLHVSDEVIEGSLEHLHRSIILPGCAGQAGLCHYGQFEPNLTTAALAYENLVGRPSLERTKQLRVAPGHPEASLLIDKLRDHDVLSQMPLGADPLAEEQIQAIESWIRDGALREPSATPAPVLNNPPVAPQIGVFDENGLRIDTTAGAVVAPGGAITLRHSVQDFEVDDAAVFFSVFVMSTADGMQVLFDPSLQDGAELALTTYDALGPESQGDLLNYRFELTVPEVLDIQDPATLVRSQRPSAGESLTVIAAYLDQGVEKDGIFVYAVAPNFLQIEGP